MRHRRTRVAIVALSAVLLAVSGGTARARTYTVDDPADAVDDDLSDVVCHTAGGHCSLRAAIQTSNAHPVLGATNIVRLPPNTYTLTIPGVGEDDAATGDLDITHATAIVGTGTKASDVVIDGNSVDRVFDVRIAASNESAFFRSVVITGGFATTGPGGGIYHGPGGGLSLYIVEVVGNTAAASGLEWGGGIYSIGPLGVNASTIASNVASDGKGAGIYNGDEAQIASATVAENSGASFGAGIYNDSPKESALNSVTIAGNVGAQFVDGGGLYNAAPSVIYVFNGIIADNSGAGSGPNDCSGTITAGELLVEDTTGCTFDGDPASVRSGVAPGLAALADNGGPTRTIALDLGSPARDAGSLSDDFYLGCRGDQRNAGRTDGIYGPYDGDGDGDVRCDLGAYEAGCGNLFPDPGEDCDAQSCCSASCTFAAAQTVCGACRVCDANGGCNVFAPAGTFCTPCSVCDAGGECTIGPAPPAFCATPPSMKGVLLLKKGVSPEKDRLKWTWANGPAISPAQLGDPTTTDPDQTYTLCLFGQGPSLLLRADVSPGTTCGTRPCWSKLAGGKLKFRDTAHAYGGIESISLRPSDSGRSKIVVQGKGANLSELPTAPLALPVQVELHRALECWRSTYSTAAQTLRNEALPNGTAVFKGRSD